MGFNSSIESRVSQVAISNLAVLGLLGRDLHMRRPSVHLSLQYLRGWECTCLSFRVTVPNRESYYDYLQGIVREGREKDIRGMRPGLIRSLDLQPQLHILFPVAGGRPQARVAWLGQSEHGPSLCLWFPAAGQIGLTSQEFLSLPPETKHHHASKSTTSAASGQPSLHILTTY